MRILFGKSAIAVLFKIIILLFLPIITHAETFIFVSFSMPKESLEHWINESVKHQIPVFIRGLKNNSLNETIEYLKLFEPIPKNLLIDPERFTQYQISKVPAVVVTHSNDYDVIYGELSLKKALGSNYE